VRPIRFASGVRSVRRGEPSGPPPASPLPRVTDVVEAHDEVAQLLAEGPPAPGRLTTDRSVEYLRWRYAEPPGLDYRAVPIHQDGRLCGLAIGRSRLRGSLVEFTLSELLVRSGDQRTARRLLAAVSRAGCDHVTAYLPPELPVHLGLRHGYLGSRRARITLVANPLADLRPDPRRPDSWSLSLGDLEVF
jgi:hypothetical protein